MSHHLQRLFHHINSRACFMRILAEMATELTRTRHALEQAKNVAGNVAEIGAFTQLRVDIRIQRTDDVRPGFQRCIRAEKAA